MNGPRMSGLAVCMALASLLIFPTIPLAEEAALERALAGLRSDDPAGRAKAVAWLAAVPAEAVPRLAELLRTGDDNTRYRILEALNRIGPEAGGAVPDLVSMLRDPELTIPSSTAETLARIGAAAVPALLEAATSADDCVRFWSLYSLGRIEVMTSEVVDALATMISDPNPLIRSVAADSLLAAGSAAVPRLAALLEGPDLELAADAAGVLAGIETPEAKAALARFQGKPGTRGGRL